MSMLSKISLFNSACAIAFVASCATPGTSEAASYVIGSQGGYFSITPAESTNIADTKKITLVVNSKGNLVAASEGQDNLIMVGHTAYVSGPSAHEMEKFHENILLAYEEFEQAKIPGLTFFKQPSFTVNEAINAPQWNNQERVPNALYSASAKPQNVSTRTDTAAKSSLVDLGNPYSLVRLEPLSRSLPPASLNVTYNLFENSKTGIYFPMFVPSRDSLIDFFDVDANDAATVGDLPRTYVSETSFLPKAGAVAVPLSSTGLASLLTPDQLAAINNLPAYQHNSFLQHLAQSHNPLKLARLCKELEFHFLNDNPAKRNFALAQKLIHVGIQACNQSPDVHSRSAQTLLAQLKGDQFWVDKMLGVVEKPDVVTLVTDNIAPPVGLTSGRDLSGQPETPALTQSRNVTPQASIIKPAATNQNPASSAEITSLKAEINSLVAEVNTLKKPKSFWQRFVGLFAFNSQASAIEPPVRYTDSQEQVIPPELAYVDYSPIYTEQVNPVDVANGQTFINREIAASDNPATISLANSDVITQSITAKWREARVAFATWKKSPDQAGATQAVSEALIAMVQSIQSDPNADAATKFKAARYAINKFNFKINVANGKPQIVFDANSDIKLQALGIIQSTIANINDIQLHGQAQRFANNTIKKFRAQGLIGIGPMGGVA